MRRATWDDFKYFMGEVISIHALREEGDTKLTVRKQTHTTFLSTPSVRRATNYKILRKVSNIISIHALREEGDMAYNAWFCLPLISIHALREEGDHAR